MFFIMNLKVELGSAFVLLVPKIKFYYGVKASSMDEAQVESAKFAEWAKAQA